MTRYAKTGVSPGEFKKTQLIPLHNQHKQEFATALWQDSGD
jgi:hypothetical protein